MFGRLIDDVLNPRRKTIFIYVSFSPVSRYKASGREIMSELCCSSVLNIKGTEFGISKFDCLI